jgi:hypothetical protein
MSPCDLDIPSFITRQQAWSISFVRDPSLSGLSNLVFLFIIFVFALRQYVQNVRKWSQWKKKQLFSFSAEPRHKSLGGLKRV